MKRVDGESRVFAVEIGEATPSLNEIMAWRYRPSLRRWRYPAYRAALRAALVSALDGAPLQQAGGPSKVRVKVIRYSSGVLDDDNLRGGCKPLMDTLVELGVLHDDSPAWLEGQYEQRLAKRGDKRTRIEIEVL